MTQSEEQTKIEASVPEAKATLRAERGALVYGEGKNKKALAVRRMYLVGDILAVVGFIGLSVILLVFVFYIFQFPFIVQVLGSLLTGALLYWALLFVGDIRRIRRAVRPLRVYENGVRLPTGSEDDFEHGRAPKLLPYEDIAAFYPNEGRLNMPYFAVTLNNPDADPIIIPKELVGNWGKFRRAVKELMQTHKGWYFLKGVGPVYGGTVETDDLHLRYGPKDGVVELTWDAISGEPKSHMKGLKRLAIVTIKLRKGGRLKLLLPLSEADQLIKNYKNYVNRFWKEPEKEEARWEKLDIPEDERDED